MANNGFVRSNRNKYSESYTQIQNTLDTDGLVSAAERLLELTQDQVAARNAEVKTVESITKANENLANILDNIYERDKKAQDAELKFNLQIQAIEKKRAELKAKGAKNLTAEEKQQKNLLKIAENKLKAEKNLDKLQNSYYSTRLQAEKELENQQKAYSAASKEIFKDGLKHLDFKEMGSGIKGMLTGGASGGQAIGNVIGNLTNGLANLGKKLDKTIEEIVSYKSDWDTRLFGSNTNYSSLVDAVSNSLGATPYVKQSTVMQNINKAIESGIAFNVEQRAFLESVKDDIAGTFDAFDSTLLQIVRVQQSDSTASRLGMEASLNAFLNNMYSNTEYLNNLSDSVTGSLYEATSLLNARESIGFEGQVQKWLGSLYSVGMSQNAVSNIAQALGQLGSGNVSGTTSGAGKLLVMAASRAGLDYSKLLTDGLNDSEINSLLESMVTYLQEIANSNRVVQSQYAAVYGLATSDIVAARNLAGSVSDITNFNINDSTSTSMLKSMAETIGQRMTTGEKIKNAIDNLQYTMASGIAESTALYSVWAISGMMDEYLNGIPIPTISVMGSSVDLKTSVANIMRVGALAGGLMSGIGSLINAGGALTNSWKMFENLGIGSSNTVTRGTGFVMSSGQIGTSGTSVVGNTAGEDVYSASMASAEDQKQEAKSNATVNEEDKDIKLADLQSSVIQIYELLSDIADGSRSFTVVEKIEGLNPEIIGG